MKNFLAVLDRIEFPSHSSLMSLSVAKYLSLVALAADEYAILLESNQNQRIS